MVTMLEQKNNVPVIVNVKVLTSRLPSPPPARCREGYQGIRCDQFLPKTDSILSDPSKTLTRETAATLHVTAQSQRRFSALDSKKKNNTLSTLVTLVS